MNLAPESIGLIAGSRTLPLEFARLARAAGVKRIVCTAVEGETDPALAALVRSNQNAIKRYEQSPTPSQKMRSTIKLSAKRSPSMELMNRDMYAKNLEKRKSPFM